MNLHDNFIIKKYKKLGIKLPECKVCKRPCEDGRMFCSDKCLLIDEESV